MRTGDRREEVVKEGEIIYNYYDSVDHSSPGAKEVMLAA